MTFPISISWLIPVHFSSPTCEIAFPDTKTLICYWQQMLFLLRIRVFFPFCFIPFLLFICQGLFCFPCLLSCLLSYSFTFLPLKLSCSPLFPHLYCLASATCVLFLPWGISIPFFFCIFLSQLYFLHSPLPSGTWCLQILEAADEPK